MARRFVCEAATLGRTGASGEVQGDERNGSELPQPFVRFAGTQGLSLAGAVGCHRRGHSRAHPRLSTCPTTHTLSVAALLRGDRSRPRSPSGSSSST